MSQIKSKNTKPEILVRKFLFAHKFRYRLHNNKLPGSPDLCFPKYQTVLFVHGCFWHGHNKCKYASAPKTRTEWWENKINLNKKRDADKRALLEDAGWRVLTVWECALKPKQRQATLELLTKELLSNGRTEVY